MAHRGREVAAIIVEPVAGNMGVVPPAPGFLAGLRDARARATAALLIFDEVITGLPRRLGRRPGPLRSPPGSHVPRQDHRRRAPGRRLRRIARASWSASRRSAASTRRARSPAIRSRWPRAWPRCARSSARASTSGSRRWARGVERGRRPRPPGAAGVPVTDQPGRLDAHRVLHRRPGDRLRLGEAGGHRALRAATSTRCWRAACSSRPRSSRRRSCRWPMARPTSPRPRGSPAGLSDAAGRGAAEGQPSAIDL